MNHESAARGGAPADLAQEVEDKSTEGREQGARTLTVKQRGRWSPMTVEGILARDATTAQANDLAMALGKAMRKDGSFDSIHDGKDAAICVEVRPVHRDKVRRLLKLSEWSWGDYVRRWMEAGIAHRCPDLPRGSVRLLVEPASACPVPSCGEPLPTATVDRCSEQGSTLPTATESVLPAGAASRDAEGDESLDSPESEKLEVPGGPTVQAGFSSTLPPVHRTRVLRTDEASSEVAALAHKVIEEERGYGTSDRDIAGFLNGQPDLFPPPVGFVRWTGHAVRIAMEADRAA